METGWRYRALAIGGAATLTAAATLTVNAPQTQAVLAALPVLNNLRPRSVTGGILVTKVAMTLAVVLGVLWPLFKPRPRRILDTVSLTERRLFLAATALATVGYFDWSSRLPRLTLIGTVALLSVGLPAWFVAIRRRPRTVSRAVIVGDDPAAVARLRTAADVPVLGYVAPPAVEPAPGGTGTGTAAARTTDGGVPASLPAAGDGAADLSRLGGLSRLETVLVDHDVDTVLLGFERPDREEFFGVLSTCHEHGVRVQVHRDDADGVLVDDAVGAELVDTAVEPWDWQDRALKRLFDVGFAATALLALSPAIAVIAAAVKLDSEGPVLYGQRRTAAFGDTFRIYKFRSMVADAESATGARLSEEDRGGRDSRVTRVGRVLRATHLDEIPQLWSVLVGDMSVVGPRPERPELDADIETDLSGWPSRWFVRPGLTGLAQINDVTGHDPERKLRYDLEYIRNQSFWTDLKIVVRQLWLVVVDAWALVAGDGRA